VALRSDATVCHLGSGGSPSASVRPRCVVGRDLYLPGDHAWHKGAVERARTPIAQSWWRTQSDEVTVAAAQASLDRLCVKLDGREPSGPEYGRQAVSSLMPADPAAR
jgi:hypothetical protein